MIYWTTGRSFIGKSTFIIKAIDKLRGAEALHIGTAIRKKIGEAGILKEKGDASCPESLDVGIEESIVDFLTKYHDKTILFIDGYPRNERQVLRIPELLSEVDAGLMKHKSVIALLDLDGERIGDGLTMDQVHLLDERKKTEKALYDSVSACFLKHAHTALSGIGFTYCMMSTNTPTDAWLFRLGISPMFSSESNLDYLMKNHAQLDEEYRVRYGLSPSVIDSQKLLDTTGAEKYCAVSFMSDMIRRTVEELYELREQVTGKFWDNVKIDARKSRVEVIDAMHFIFTICASLGMRGCDIGKIYLEKRSVNLHRIQHGKTKGDDAHAGHLFS